MESLIDRNLPKIENQSTIIQRKRAKEEINSDITRESRGAYANRIMKCVPTFANNTRSQAKRMHPKTTITSPSRMTRGRQHGYKTPAIPFWAYIETLPAWERDLLLSVVIFPEWDDIIDQEETKILGVSDGGHKDDYGSFGWAIATDMEPKTNLVQNNGLARGQPMSSHRAEAYGRISILLFLVRYAEYRGKPYSTSLQTIMYCDNSGVLTTEKRLKRGVESPYCQLNPDHNVLVTIAELSAKLPENFRTKHVHVHQDNALEYQELSRPAQLNVDADGLATIALQSALAEGATALQTIPLPSCQAYLLNREGCIISSGEVKHHLRLSMPEENLKNHLQQHHDGQTTLYTALTGSHS